MIGGPKILCVYKSGGDFLPFHVKRLADQVRAHAGEMPFLCLTDKPTNIAEIGVEAMPIEPTFKGWWNKLHALRVPGPCLYLDLDVNVVGDLAPLLEAAAEHELITLADFWVEGPHRINSSVLGWRGDMSAIYKEFAESPAAFMSLYSSKAMWGDQRFLADTYTGEPALWQDILPGMLVSFKLGALKGADLSDARVVVSHGLPRPWGDGGADAWLAKRQRAR
jgi:hypothetical protein